MRRREFITLVGTIAAWPLAARAQQGERLRRIGVLTPFTEGDQETKAWLIAFQEGLQELGWAQGRNVSIDYRWAEDRLQINAAELVKTAPDVLFAVATPALEALRQQTDSLPRFPIRSNSASSRTSHGRAATSLGLPISNTPSAANGWN